jgi:hypothetical protein
VTVKLFGVAWVCGPVVAAIELENVACVVSAGPELKVARETVAGLACVVPAVQVVEYVCV